MSQKETRYYLRVGEEKKGFADKVRNLMKEFFRLTSTEFHVSGGGDGDLHEETAEWNLFHAGYDERVELYTLCDNGANGYAECLSVICHLPDGDQSDGIQVLLAFLGEHDFVGKNTSFEKRPGGYKTYASYLDKAYSPAMKPPFVTKNGSGD